MVRPVDSTVGNVDGSRETLGTKVRILTHCPSSSKWVPGGNIGELEVVRKGTGHPYINMSTARGKCSV